MVLKKWGVSSFSAQRNARSVGRLPDNGIVIHVRNGQEDKIHQVTVSRLRDQLSEYINNPDPVRVTNRGRVAGYWLPEASILQEEEEGQEEARKKAYEQATAQFRLVKSMTDPDDALDAIQEIEDLRDAEGVIE